MDASESLLGAQRPPDYSGERECSSPLMPLSREKSREVTALRIAIVFCIAFMIAEVIGGYMAHSLAILTDAAHLLTDVGAFGLSLFAIHATQRGSDHTYSYGFHRAEVLGTLASVFTIWFLVGAIVVEALGRIRDMKRCAERYGKHTVPLPSPDDCVAVESFIMIVIGILGLIVNLGCAAILSWGGSHGHSHSLGGGHGHGDHGDDDHEHRHDSHGDSHEDHGDHGHNHDSHGHSHDDHGQSHEDHDTGKKSLALNAAFLHALGDCIQSVGVILAGLFIYYANRNVYGDPVEAHSYYNLADPCCSLLFAVVTLFTTRGLIKQLVQILMESTPDGVDYPGIRRELRSLKSVEGVHDLHIWSLTSDKTALSVHIVASDHTQVLVAAREICKRHRIDHCTIQIDPPGNEAKHCETSMGCHNC